MYVESDTESFDAQMEFLWEKERLAPLIAQTTHFTSELAQTAMGAALNIWKRSEMGRAWKACDTIACKRLKDHLIFSEHSTSATIHSLAMHDVLNKRRFRRAQIGTRFINVHATLLPGEVFKGVLDTRGSAHSSNILTPPTEETAFQEAPFQPTDQLTKFHVGRLASGLSVAYALDFLAAKQDDHHKPLTIPDSTNIIEAWRNQGSPLAVSFALSSIPEGFGLRATAKPSVRVPTQPHTSLVTSIGMK